jgi:hypothetical protein
MSIAIDGVCDTAAVLIPQSKKIGCMKTIFGYQNSELIGYRGGVID